MLNKVDGNKWQELIQIRLKFYPDLKLVSSGIWNGVVGKVFYGEADAGITNIDITYQRLALTLVMMGGGGLSLPLNFFFSTLHNLITFSIVFTNKNRGDTLSPPPSS